MSKQPPASWLDDFFNKNKPQGSISKPPTGKKKMKKPEPKQEPITPTNISVLEEWPDIISDKAQHLDISTLDDDQVEHALRLFDFNPAYGPFVGISRLSRWHRADDWGLNPPPVIKNIIENKQAVASRSGRALW